jgi:trans-aconitate methyltransferase
MTRDHFDADYYRRFYGRAPVHTAARLGHLAGAVDGLCAWWGIKVRSVLDVGAGPGYWGRWYGQHRPGVRYQGIDVSDYACQRYGHQRADIAVWAPRRPFDLVICQSVLQYLDDTRAESAIDHLAAATRHVLFLEVPTRDDYRHVIDPAATDLECHWRSGAWYRQRLEAHFDFVGAGLWARHGAPVAFYELEAGF